MRRVLLVALAVSLLTSLVTPAGAHEGQAPDGVDAGLLLKEDHGPMEVAAKRPHQVFEFENGRISGIAKGLSEDAQAYALEMRSMLNNAADEGWVELHETGNMSLTADGKSELLQILESGDPGNCLRFSNLAVSHAGYAADVEQTCSDAEMDALIAGQLEAAGEITKSRLASWHSNPLGPVFGRDFNCLVSLVGLAIGLMSILLLVAFPPAGAATWVVWLSWTLAVSGSYAAWFSTVVNCTGIRSVRVDEHFAASAPVTRHAAADRYCAYGYQSSYRWDSYLGKSVPTYIRWNC